MDTRKTLFISIEGLGTNLVGAYGNSVAPTPNLDRLATRGLVLDQFWSDSANSLETLESLWTGSHALARHASPFEANAWRQALSQGLLVTDDPRLAESSVVELFDRVLLIEQEDLRTQELQFERLVEGALGTWTQQLDETPLLWIHTKGLRGVWDAPQEYRTMLCDEGDPEPPHGKEPMSLSIQASTDPDEVFRIACAVGGQAFAIDEILGELMDTLDELKIAPHCLLGVLGVSGYPLGEHGWVGGSDTSLFAETLHLPFLVRPGDLLPLGMRVATITQPHELSEILSDWFSPYIDLPALSDWVYDLGSAHFDGETRVGAAIAVQNSISYVCSPAWSCRLTHTEGESPRVQLWVKPDDRWEQNEISSRATHIVEKMQVLGETLIHHYRTPVESRSAINWLDDELIRLHR